MADHLDALGHFGDAAHDPPHVDWLVSGSGFDRPHFEALMGDVTGSSLPREGHLAGARQVPQPVNPSLTGYGLGSGEGLPERDDELSDLR